MKQTKMDDFFNIKYKNKLKNSKPDSKLDSKPYSKLDSKLNKNNITPNNTPNYGSTDTLTFNVKTTKEINMFQLNDKLPTYVLRFDGASKGNPGKAGAGAVLYKNDVEIWSTSRYLGNQTNNYAECFAMTLGITEACNREIKNLVVEGDSMLVINHLKKKWKVNNQNLKNLYLSIHKSLERFDNISFKHIYRNYNKRADELANIGVTMAP